MTASTAALFLLALVATAASSAELAPSPTALESFVARPSVVLDLAVDVGVIRSTNATVTVTALMGTDTAEPTLRMQGLRFTMADNGGIEQAWLEESELRALLTDLDDIEDGIPELKAGTDAPWRIHGTGSCWMPPQPTRILCPSYRVGPEGSAMGLAAYGGRGFSYPGTRPSALAALVERAIARLEAP